MLKHAGQQRLQHARSARAHCDEDYLGTRLYAHIQGFLERSGGCSLEALDKQHHGQIKWFGG